jgi:hypothetical protein
MWLYSHNVTNRNINSFIGGSMKQTITESQFVDAFTDCSRADNFTYAGRKAMFEYFEQLEDDCDMEIEFDVIAICCEYTEYENLEEFQANYGADDYPDMEAIRDATQLIEIDDESFIIQCF